MEASPLGQPNLSVQRPQSIWIATAALVAMAVGNFFVLLVLELSRSTESEADGSPFSWLLVVWLSLYSIGVWTGWGQRWFYVVAGVVIASVFALVIVILAACRSPFWEAYLFAAGNGLLSFAVCFAMATESAKRYFESNR